LALFLLCVLVLTFSGGCGKKKPADKVAPTVPNGISITAVSSSEIKVSWKPSADEFGKIKNYKVYRNGKYLATTESTSASDKTLTPNAKFCFRVSAVDEAGNESAQSTEVCAIL
jgi:chitodextrinase